MKKLQSVLLWLVLLSYTLEAQQITQQFTYTASNVKRTKINAVYDVVTLPETSFLDDSVLAGNPQLPVKTFSMLLPKGATASNVSIRVNSEQQLAGTFYLYPQQPPVYVSNQELPAFVEPNVAIYNSNSPYPAQTLQQYNTNGYRDYNYVTISFIPFRYHPLSRKLYLFTNIAVTIDYTVNSDIQPYKLRPYT